jgi:hypothetical protein
MSALPSTLVRLLALPALTALAPAAEVWRFAASAAAEPSGRQLLLAPRARIAPVGGRAALAPGPAGKGPAALLVNPDTRRGAEIAGTTLELGTGPWDIEARLWLDPGAGPEEGVLLALGPADGEPILRLGVLPAEDAFILAALGPADDHGVHSPGQAREFADPRGPPHQRYRELIVLLTPAGPLPRGRWFHLTWRFDGIRTLHLTVDGSDGAAATARLVDPPRGAGLQLTLGGDRQGGRPWPGAIAEVAILQPESSR